MKGKTMNTYLITNTKDVRDHFEKDFLSVNGWYRKIQYRNKPFQVEIFKSTSPFGEIPIDVCSLLSLYANKA